MLFLGLPASYESEGYDRTHIDLPAQQIGLLRRVAAVNPNVAVVLSNGSVVTVSPWIDDIPAVLEGWLLGQAGGGALADILIGVVNPSGRLAETIPVCLEHNPSHGSFPGEHGHVVYREGLLVGYRWYDTRRLPAAFPFGHGLGYTRFVHSDLALTVHDTQEPRVDVTLTVTNTGDRAGTETVQVYVADPVATVHRPEQELRGFARVRSDAGASEQVTVTLHRRAFAFWHSAAHRWVIEGGTFEVRIGASSRDIRLTGAIELPGDVIVTL